MDAFLSNFIYSVNVILPIFLLLLLGIFLKRIGFLKDSFTDIADKLVFKVGLPCMLFLDVAGASLSEFMSVKLVLFSVISVTVSFIVLSFIMIFVTKDNGKRGAMTQGICRSNFAILGVPLLSGMFGHEGSTLVAFLMPIVILMYNSYSVIVLSVFAPSEKHLTAAQTLKKIGKSIVTNPLIISVVLGIPFMLTGWELPMAAEKTVSYLSGLATPLSLLSLGATFSLKSFHGRFAYAITGSLAKTIVMPGIMCTLAALIGLRGAPLGTILIMFGTPTAVSSYIMAKNMGSDHELAGQILLLTTGMCVFTIFLGVFVLKTLGLI